MDWLKIRKAVCQGCGSSPYLFNLYAEYIMWNARLDESQAETKIARRNINNLRYANDTTLMAESEEELKSLLMREKEESEKAGLKLNIQKMKIMAPGPITSWQIGREKNGNSGRFYFLWLQNLQIVTAETKVKDLCSLEESYNPGQCLIKQTSLCCQRSI